MVVVVVVAVVVLCDEFAGRFRVVVVQPQVRIGRDVLTGLVAVAIDDNKALLIECKVDVGFFGDCQRIGVRLERCQQAQEE